MEVDKFGRRRKNDSSSHSIPSYQLLQLERNLKSDVQSFLIEKNLDKLILTKTLETEGSPIRVRNVHTDQDSFPADAVNISYLRLELERQISIMLAGKNLHKLLLLTGEDHEDLIRIRNIRVDENSLPTDAVNLAYVSRGLNVLMEKISKLEKEIESMKNLSVDAKSITYSKDAATMSFSG